MRNANKMTLLGAMLMTAVSAQAFNVKGTIVDKTTKEPLIGATIQIEGTTTGAITDIDGRFELSNLKGNNCTLVIQYVSYPAHNNKCRTKRRTGHRTCSRYSDHGGSYSYSPEESGK